LIAEPAEHFSGVGFRDGGPFLPGLPYCQQGGTLFQEFMYPALAHLC
jgi:hypothetical protein